MTVRAPVPMSGDVAEDFRLGLNGLMSGLGTGGVLYHSGLGGYEVYAQSPAAMAVNVASGAGVVAGTVSATQGAYLMWNDGIVAQAINAADAVNPRIDLIGLHVNDSVYDPNDPLSSGIVYVAGTPAATPVAPAIPESTLVLAQISVPAGATTITSGNIADERVLVGTVTPGKIAGRMYQTSQVILSTGGAASQIGNMVEDYAYGVTYANNALTVPVSGLYRVSAQLGWQASNAPPGTGVYSVGVYVNGSRRRAANLPLPTDTQNNAFPTPSICDLISLNGGDEVTLWGWQNSVGNEGTLTGSANTWLSLSLEGV